MKSLCERDEVKKSVKSTINSQHANFPLFCKPRYSHYGSCAFPNDLDAEWFGHNDNLVKSLVLISLRSGRK